MFSTMIASLKQGKEPDTKELSKRFTIALVKKMGFLKQPYLFWPSDPKINPPAEHLLWATVVLTDQDKFELVAGILLTEQLESSQNQHSGLDKLQKKLISQSLEALLQICGDDTQRNKMLQKIHLICDHFPHSHHHEPV